MDRRAWWATAHEVTRVGHDLVTVSFIHSLWSHHTGLWVLFLKHTGWTGWSSCSETLPSTVSWLLLLPLLNFVQTSPSQTGLLRPPCLGCIQPPLIPTPLCFTFLLLYQHLTSLLPIIISFIIFLPSVKWMLYKFRDFSSFSFPAESEHLQHCFAHSG